ncbi:uncharacterized protein LOC110183114 isoform X2 [Drosophila serrata]|uniref:uncharacterized protein LOC110183114 isoform X1 n=1 Tax=Drosophila serrata TaxID=7274 RepID=UPI000A1D1B5B|nr:uncharacterized protein LOC110183114 isoform X1 [Drosophila serrata]XP_020806963.1 uncharacterized protein LOC110183114 isoform X2 [Drosophila serrata]
MRFLLLSAAVLLLQAKAAVTKETECFHNGIGILKASSREIERICPDRQELYEENIVLTGTMAKLDKQNRILDEKLEAALAEISKLRESQRVKEVPKDLPPLI